MGHVYRVFDRLTGEQMALKRVTHYLTTNNEPPTPPSSQHTPFVTLPVEDAHHNPQVALAHEFQALAGLHHPNIITVQDYGFVAHEPYFTMDLLEGAKTVVEVGRGQPLEVQVGLLVQLLQALVYLHRRGFVHRDLKPSNVLVANGQVKVLDFGLAMQIERAAGTMGTVAYMAPEVLVGETVTAAADLYAVGVMAYEMIGGQHPFSNADSQPVVQRILFEPPNLQLLMPAGEVMVAIIERLLSKEPQRRYQRAVEVLEALEKAVGRPFPLETETTRESFLQAAQFVGREGELTQLKIALVDALNSKGSGWLIGGESGVGKSRLVEELRILALVRGVLVVRGQAARTGGGTYGLWRRILRRLVLEVGVDGLDESVLKELVVDIGQLLEREVIDAPVLDPKAAQTRLMGTVVNLVQRQMERQPVMLLLEDLQWAGEESLELLGVLGRLTKERGLLIIGTYRDNEMPALPARFPDMFSLPLSPLADDAIVRLGEAMIGAAGRQSQVLELLRQETAGNPFFLVEMVRALAEEVGQLEKIGTAEMPAQKFAGSRQRLVQRRLTQIAEADRSLLEFAAIVGRQLDLTIIQAAFPNVDLERWLTSCANAAILDIQEQHWRFAHDQLRDGVLATLPPVQQKKWHRLVAEAIETAYPNTPDKAASLAYHWREGQEASKEGQYAALAGEQALRSGANQVAAQFLERALALQSEMGMSLLQKGRLMRLLGQAYIGLGQLPHSRDRLQEMVGMLGWKVPASRPQMILSILRQLATQSWYRLRSPLALASVASPDDPRLEAARAYQELSEIYYFANDPLRVLNATLHTLNLAEMAGLSPELARAYANICVVAGLLRQGQIVALYSRLGKKTGEQLADMPALSWVYLMHGTYLVGQGQWDQAWQTSISSIELCQQTGDKRIMGLALGLQAIIPYHQGRFSDCAGIYAQWQKIAAEVGNLQHQGMALCSQVDCLAKLGELDQAAALAADGIALLSRLPAETIDLMTPLRNYAALSVTRLRQRAWNEAAIAAKQGLSYITRARAITRVTGSDGLANLAEVCLTLWSRHPNDPHWQADAKQACDALSSYAQRFPIGKPRAALYQGWYQWLKGNSSQALKNWRKSLANAGTLSMPYEQALAHAYLGQYSNSPDRHTHLQQADTLFQTLGTQQPIIFQ